MSLNTFECQMAMATITREYTPGSCHNSSKHRRFPLGTKLGPIPLHWVQSNSVFPIKQVRILNLIDGNLESPQNTLTCLQGLMSPQ